MLHEFTSKENFMKKTLLLVALLLVMRSTGWASNCTVGTLSSYLALGAGGCTLDGKTFTHFGYSGAGTFPIPASEITVTPCPSSLCSATGVLPGEEGFVFNAAWQVGPGQTLDSLIAYTVTSGTDIVDVFLAAAGMSAGGGGLASVAETLSNGENLTVSTVFRFCNFSRRYEFDGAERHRTLRWRRCGTDLRRSERVLANCENSGARLAAAAGFWSSGTGRSRAPPRVLAFLNQD